MKYGAIAPTATRIAFALREWWTARHLHWHFLGIVVAAGAFALLGPFGTWDRLPLPTRFAYWGCAIGANWVFALTVAPTAVYACLRQGISEWAGLAAGCLVAALPGSGAIAFLNAVVGDPFVGAPALGGLYVRVLLVHALLGSLAYALIERPILKRRQRERDGAPVAETLPHPEGGFPAPDSGAGALLNELPAHLGRELIRLRMKDHYVEVHTPLGHALVLMRFRDALRSVENLDGMQVHRSHWVARRAVAGAEQRSGRTGLLLRGGEFVPVSRSFLPALRAAGWISDPSRPRRERERRRTVAGEPGAQDNRATMREPRIAETRHHRPSGTGLDRRGP